MRSNNDLTETKSFSTEVSPEGEWGITACTKKQKKAFAERKIHLSFSRVILMVVLLGADCEIFCKLTQDFAIFLLLTLSLFCILF